MYVCMITIPLDILWGFANHKLTLYILMNFICSLEKIWCDETIFVGSQVRQKLNTQKFSYHKEIEQFIMVCSLPRRKLFITIFSHEYFQPLIFPNYGMAAYCCYIAIYVGAYLTAYL